MSLSGPKQTFAQDGVERLRLCGCSDVAVDRKIVDERCDALRAEHTGVLFAVEQDVAADPESVSFFGTPAQVATAAKRGHLVHEARGWRGSVQFTP